MKKMFTGFKEVFTFTFVQNVKTKSFKTAVIGVSLLLFIAFFAVNMITGAYKDHKYKDKDKKEEKNTVEKLFFTNMTQMKDFDIRPFAAFDEFEREMGIVDYGSVSKVEEETIKKNIEAAEEREENVMFIILAEEEEQDNCYEVRVYYSSGCKKAHVKQVAKDFTEYFDTCKLTLAGIDADAMELVMSDSMVGMDNIADADKSIGQIMIEIFVPMFVVLIMYMLILVHGQSISKIIVVEKNSKLMEMLLISVRPYAIIAGKVIAMYVVAVIEMTSWVLSSVLGYLISDRLAKEIFRHYDNPVMMVLRLLKNEINEAFGAPAVIMCIISVLIGFLVYCVLSAMIASGITKAEELANSSGIYQIIVVVGYMVAFFVPLAGDSNGLLARVLRYIPVTSPYMLPSDVLIGSISVAGAVISNLILIATMLVMILFTGKIYKKKVF